MKKLFLLPLLAFFLVFGKAEASHLVGGEIVITHIQGFDYTLSMNLYRDAGGISAPMTAQITALQRTTLGQVGSWTLPLLWDSIVPPEIPGCGGSQVIIERYYYELQVTLPPTTYNHPGGYMFTWSSCCRNAGVVNIQNSSGAGQRTVTMFPPVVSPNPALPPNTQFVNSTPQLFPPLADYGCVGQFYYQEFGGLDPDGDSLSYVLYTPFEDNPLNGGIVNPISAPYPDPSTMATPIQWANCYNVNNQINGFSDGSCTSLNEPDRLRVNANTGFVSVTPAFGPAYYVIGVWCQEWRDIDGDGQKDLIGSVFRDFQLQVTTNCAPGSPPDPPLPVDTSVTVTDTIFVPGIVGQRCVQYKVTDPNAGSAIPLPASDVEIILDAVNFPDSTIGVTPKSLLLQSPQDTVTIDLCFGDCAFSQNGEPLQLNVVYKKIHCPKPIFDTVALYFLVEEIPSPEAIVQVDKVDFGNALFLADTGAGGNVEQITFGIRPNWEIEMEFNVIDSTYDSLRQYLVYNYDTLDYRDFGVEFFQYSPDTLAPADSISQTDTIIGLSNMKTRLKWRPDCSLFQPGQPFEDTMYLITEDFYCGQNVSSKMLVFSILTLNENPIILADTSVGGTENPETIAPMDPSAPILTYEFTKRVGTDRSIGGSGKKKGESLIFDIISSDADLDEIYTTYQVWDEATGDYLDPLNSRFLLTQLGMVTGRANNNIGDSTLTSNFYWENRYITCDALVESPIRLRAIATDSSCFAAEDTMDIIINLENGTPPELEFYQDFDRGTEKVERDADGNIEITFQSENLSFFVTGFDNDVVEIEPGETEGDKVRLAMTLENEDINDTEDVFIEKGIEAIYRNPLQYVERQDTIFFFWDPACEDRNLPLERLNFKVRDNACPSDPNDAELGLIDEMFVNIAPVGEFEAINLITPNGDGLNDALRLYDTDYSEGSRTEIIEPMRCGFESVKVFNRWGQQVFESNSADFEWDANDVPSGDYFYEMKFGNRTYRSYLKILK